MYEQLIDVKLKKLLIDGLMNEWMLMDDCWRMNERMNVCDEVNH